MSLIKMALVFIIGYFAGCFQTSYIIGKNFKQVDIRKHGSGNAGATNAFRVFGAKIGLLAFIGDFLKSFITVSLVLYISNDNFLALLSGLGVIIGHDFPVFLKFKGGKGIASTLGLAFALNYVLGTILILLMLFIILTTRYVSLASIVMSIIISPLIYFMMGKDIRLTMLGLFIGILAIFQHRSNIKKLLTASENKIKFKKH